MRLGWGTAGLFVAVGLAVLGLSHVAVLQLYAGNGGLANGIVLVLVTAMVFGYVAALVLARKRKPPADPPVDGFSATIRVRAGDTTLGRETGTVRFDGAWLEFWSERTAFRLRASDLGKWNAERGFEVPTPEGIRPRRLRFYADPRRAKEWKAAFETWRNAPLTPGDPILPPLKPGTQISDPWASVRNMIPAAIAVSILIAAAMAWITFLPSDKPRDLVAAVIAPIFGGFYVLLSGFLMTFRARELRKAESEVDAR